MKTVENQIDVQNGKANLPGKTLDKNVQLLAIPEAGLEPAAF